MGKILVGFLLVIGLFFFLLVLGGIAKNKGASLEDDVPAVIAQEDMNSSVVSGRGYVLGSGDHRFTLEHDGETREYEVHVPSSYTKTPTPLVINFHGGGGTIQTAKDETQMNTKSNSAGFIVVYPQSLEAPDGGTRWNVGFDRATEPQKESSAEDVGFIRAMVAQLEEDFNIDSKRIYATGISNGGYMTYKVMCDLSDVIAAGAAVGTTLVTSNCNPSEPVSLLHIHGLEDKFVPFEGGTSDESLPEVFQVGDELSSVEESIDKFLSFNGCSSESSVTYKEGTATCTTYADCLEGTEVVLCTVGNGGHTWPGGAYPIDKLWYRLLVGELSTDLNANDEMWDFFERHTISS